MLTLEGITSFEKLFVIFVFPHDTCWVPTHQVLWEIWKLPGFRVLGFRVYILCPPLAPPQGPLKPCPSGFTLHVKITWCDQHGKVHCKWANFRFKTNFKTIISVERSSYFKNSVHFSGLVFFLQRSFFLKSSPLKWAVNF
jgi:hypothetical protein